MNDEYKDLIAIFDDRYVRRKDCDDKHTRQDEKINSISILQERNATKLYVISKVGYAILGLLITLLGTSIWNLIVK